MVDEVRALGATHVELVVQWVQADVRATEIAPDRLETLPDGRLVEVIRHARAVGLQVVLLPIVHLLRRKEGEWRGTLAPADPAAWWASYHRFTLHYADLAAREGVAVLSVGSELVSTEADRERWAGLIGDVRAVYPGKLFYSANWDHYAEVTFWDLVDYAGITGYNVLATRADADLAELVAAWTRIRSDLRNFHARVARPILFTEIGYPSQDGAAMHPWDYTTGRDIDLEEQRLCYEAVRIVWQGEPILAGLYWWNWFGYGGPRSAYYTPKGKPAEAVIRAWYDPGGRAAARR